MEDDLRDCWSVYNAMFDQTNDCHTVDDYCERETTAVEAHRDSFDRNITCEEDTAGC